MPLYALGPLRPQTPTEGSYWVAPDATIIGQVELGEDVGICSARRCAGQRADRIGARTNIQEAVIIHVDPGHPVSIGEGCTIVTGRSFTLHHRRQFADRMGADDIEWREDRPQLPRRANALVTRARNSPTILSSSALRPRWCGPR